MKKLNSLFILGIIVLSAVSCKKDFLDRQPLSDLSPQKFFANETDLNTYTNGFYDAYLPTIDLAVKDGQSDNMELNPYDKVVAGDIQVPTSASGTAWNWAFLRRVNYFLGNYQRSKASTEAKDHYAGVARLFRAWFYFDKVKNYGDVPWFSTTLQTNDTDLLMKARDPRALVMDSVLYDINFASTKMREKGPSGSVTRWVALALKARICLHEGTYRKYHGLPDGDKFLQNAVDAAQKIMAGPFSLYTKDGTDKSFYKLFNMVTPNDPQSTEVILAKYYDKQTFNYTHAINAQLKQGYGRSFTKSLVNTYLMKDGTPFTAQAGYATKTFADEFVGRDPRLSQTIIGPAYSRIDVSDNKTKPYAPMLGPSPTGYQQIKYFVDDPSQESWNTSFNAAIIFRLAETYLIYAEAKAELGTLTDGDLDLSVNKLRDRVGMPKLTMAAPVDPVLAADYPNTSGLGVLLEIRRERRVELAGEGFRYDDLMRWKAGALLAKPFYGMYLPGLGKYDLNNDGVVDFEIVTALPANPDKTVSYKVLGKDIFLKDGQSGYVVVNPTLIKTFNEEKNYLMPIPTTELLLNKDILKQNPFW